MSVFNLIYYRDTRLHALRGTAATDGGNYHVNDHTKRGKVFATLAEASGYANAIWAATGDILCVTQTKRNVTHTWATQKEEYR